MRFTTGKLRGHQGVGTGGVAERLERRRLLSGAGKDPAYGSDGTAVITVGTGGLAGRGAAVLADGRVLVATGQPIVNGGTGFGVVRLTAGGAVDATYGSGGTATAGFIDNNDLSDNAHLAVGADGSAVLVANATGRVGSGTVHGEVDAERFTPAGAIDPTFGTGGIVNLTALGLTSGRAVTIDAAGRVLVAGAAAGGRMAVVRLTAAGAADPTFGTAGLASVTITAGTIPANATATNLAVEADGSLLLGGVAEPSGASDYTWAFAHLSAAGVVGSSFNSTPTQQFWEWSPFDLTPLAGGGFLAGGMINGGAGVAEFTATGQLNPAFGNAGVVLIGNAQDEVVGARQNADGTILLAGFGATDAFVARCTATGGADTAFAPLGGVTMASLPGDVTQSVTGNAAVAFAADGGSAYVVTSGYQDGAVYATRFITAVPTTATVTGTVYNDAYDDAVLDSDDPRLSGRTVYADLNGNGTPDAGEPTATTATDGTYTLTGVPAGVVTAVRDVLPTGWLHAVGSESGAVVSVAAGATATGVNLGEIQPMTVAGVVYADANANGDRDVNDRAIAGATVFQDLNGNGVDDAGEPTATTAADGTYRLAGLLPGTGSELAEPQVRVVLPSAYATALLEVQGAQYGFHSGTTYRTDWPAVVGSYVRGNVGFEINGASVNLAGVTVYADLDHSGTVSAGDAVTTTDGNGQFGFAGLPVGSDTIRVVVPTGYAVPAGQTASFTATVGTNTRSYGSVQLTSAAPPAAVPATLNGLTGRVFDDANANGAFDPGELPLANATVYLDLNNDGVAEVNEPRVTTDTAGRYQFLGLADGTYVVRQLLPTGRTATSPAGGAATATVAAYPSLPGYPEQATVADLGSRAAVAAATISGTAFYDYSGDGLDQAVDNPLTNATVYLDLAKTGALAAGDPTALTDPATGAFTFNQVPAGTYVVRVVPPAGARSVPTAVTTVAGSATTGVLVSANAVAATAAAGGPYAVAEGGTVTLDASASVPPLGGSIAKVEWDWANYTGATFTATATGTKATFSAAGLDGPSQVVVGLRVTDDLGHTSLTKAVVDVTDAPPTAAFAASAATVPLGQSAAVAFTSVADPSPADVAAGFTYSFDFDNNGTFDLTGKSATAAVPAAYLATVGAHTVRGRVADKDGGYTDYSATITVADPATASVAGTAFRDANGNGLLDAGEAGAAGAVVYLDANNNGVLDAGEASVTVAAAGTYALTGLKAGTYVVRETVPAGYKLTAPSTGLYTVTLAAAQAVTGDNFANVAVPTTVQQTGTTIGTPGSYGNGGNTIAKATDGNLATFFDGPSANGNWVGLDLGAFGGVVTSVRFASRMAFASRMNGGQFQASNSPTFAAGVVTLYTIPAGANPGSTALTTATFANTTAYRYYRYLSPAGSYGDVAEVQFVGTPGGLTPTPLTGTTIGTAGSFLNGGNTIARATDGSLATFFDGPTPSGNWVGLDLGSAKTIAGIAYAPRTGYASRMVGGQVQVSTTADFSSGVTTLFTITAAPGAGTLTRVTLATPVTARYVRYLSPAGSYGDIAEFQVFA